MPKRNLTDTLANLIGDAIGDVRGKLIEEAWFGRPINDKAEIAHYEDLWFRQGGPEESAREQPDPEMEIDR